MRVFKSKWLARFARKERIGDDQLLDAVQRAERGLIDADLGDGVIKQRIARPGQGRSGGYRTIIIFRKEFRAFLVYGYAKSEQDDIGPDELEAYKRAAKRLLAAPWDTIGKGLSEGDWFEIEIARDDEAP